MKRIEELGDIDLYTAEGVFTYLKELNQIYRALTMETEYSAGALQAALGTAGGLLGWLDIDTKLRARRTTAPLRRVTETTQYSAIQVVKCAQLFKMNYNEQLSKRPNNKPSKQFSFD